MRGLDPGENHIRSVVLFQVMRNLVEGSARVRVPRTGIGTRAPGMRSNARQVQAKAEGHGHGQGGCSRLRSRSRIHLLAEPVGGMSPSRY